MNERLFLLVKNNIRRTCYRYKFYLREFKIIGTTLYLKIGNKDKHGFNVVIEKEFSTISIVKNLPVLRQGLIKAIKREQTKEELYSSKDELEKLVEQSKLIYKDE